MVGLLIISSSSPHIMWTTILSLSSLSLSLSLSLTYTHTHLRTHQCLQQTTNSEGVNWSRFASLSFSSGCCYSCSVQQLTKSLCGHSSRSGNSQKQDLCLIYSFKAFVFYTAAVILLYRTSQSPVRTLITPWILSRALTISRQTVHTALRHQHQIQVQVLGQNICIPTFPENLLV